MQLRSLLAALCVFFFAWSCANPGTPTGGPKDYYPPVVVSSTPVQGATDFSGREVVIVFDENIQLKDADSKFVMSPPTQKKPKVDAHGKVIRVSFDEDLLPATTYTLDFADCLSDLNESNVKEGFTFSFSTGESTDSMMISGNVYDPQTVEPIEGIYVLLQANLSDTAFRRVVPSRIAKTDALGRFAIKNVPADADYKVFALDDQNRNFLFDNPGEKIAWTDNLVRPGWEIRHVPDSVRTDSAYIEADTVRYVYEHIVRDTLVYTPDSLVLFAFLEDAYEQYIKTDERKARNTVRLAMNKPMARRPKISVADHGDISLFASVEYSLTNDSAMIWFTDSTIWNKDSIVLVVDYLIQDSLNNLVSKVDTLREWHYNRQLSSSKKEDRGSDRKRRKNKETKPKVPTLDIKVSSSVSPYGSVSLVSPTPYARFDWSAVSLYEKEKNKLAGRDTILYTPVSYTTDEDSNFLCRKRLKHKWTPGKNYELRIDSASVADIYGLQCDNIKHDIKVPALDTYGTLYIDIDSVAPHDYLQLVGSSGQVVRGARVPSNGKVGFRYVRPADYKLRILSDLNDNGEWDTGNYDQNLQPELFTYYMDKITVRPNWDIHINFNRRLYTPDAYVKKFGKNKQKKRNSSR